MRAKRAYSPAENADVRAARPEPSLGLIPRLRSGFRLTLNLAQDDKRTQRQRDSSLFGLAPCGVCPARGITVAAVRSYRTFSPLPRPSLWTFIRAAVILSKRFLRQRRIWASRAMRRVICDAENRPSGSLPKRPCPNAHNDGRGGMFSVALSVAEQPTLNFEKKHEI
jgi:hypothetical protein